MVVLKVRHAQDIDAERFEDEWDWATATIHVRVLTQVGVTDRRMLCDQVIDTMRETVSIGDADGMLVIPTPGPKAHLIVTAEGVEPHGLDEVWVDLVAMED